MTSLHEYESHLDDLDKHMYEKDNNIHVGLSRPFDVSLENVKNTDDLIQCLYEVTLKLLEERVNVDYLAGRFIRLASKILGKNLIHCYRRYGS